MNFKTTLTLLVLLLAVGSYFYFVESKQQTTTEREQDKAKTAAEKGTPLFTADDAKSDDVTSFTITRASGAIEITKDGSDWLQSKPVRFPLNAYNASSIVSEALALRYSEKLKAGDKDVPKLEDIGLGNKDVLSLTLAGKKSHTIRIGKKTIGGFGYVMIDSDPAIYIVGDSLHRQLLENKLNDWRKKSLTAPTDGQARRVTLVHGANNIEVVNTESNWAFSAPNSGRASKENISTLLSNLKSTYVTKFVADAPADLSMYGLDKPTLELTIEVPPPAVPASTQPDKNAAKTAEKPKIYTLRVGSAADLKKDDYFATYDDSTGTDGVVFTLVRSEVERLSKSVNDLRDPRITTLTALDVRELTLARKEASSADQAIIKLVRESKGWSFADPKPSFKADSGVISDLIEGIVESKATSFVAENKPAADALLTITLAAVGRSEPEVLRVDALTVATPGKNPAAANETPKKKYVIHRNNETTGYVVEMPENSKLAIAFEPVLALRDRNVLELPNERINAVTIKREGKLAASYTFARTVPTLAELAVSDEQKAAEKKNAKPSTQPEKKALPGPWKMAGAEKFDEMALNKLFAELTPIHAEKWVTADSKIAGKEAISITIATGEGATTTLNIDAESRVALATGIDQPFIADKSLVEALNAEFADRNVLPISLNDIKQVDVDGVVVSRDEDGKYAASSADKKINQSNAGALFDTLAGLRVERFAASAEAGDKSPRFITVTTKTGTIYKVQLSSTTNAITIGDRAGLLDDATKKKLTADLFAKEAPAAPPAGMMPNMGNFGGLQD